MHPMVNVGEAYTRGSDSIRDQATARLSAYGYRKHTEEDAQKSYDALKGQFGFRPAVQ